MGKIFDLVVLAISKAAMPKRNDSKGKGGKHKGGDKGK